MPSEFNPQTGQWGTTDAEGRFTPDAQQPTNGYLTAGANAEQGTGATYTWNQGTNPAAAQAAAYMASPAGQAAAAQWGINASQFQTAMGTNTSYSAPDGGGPQFTLASGQQWTPSGANSGVTFTPAGGVDPGTGQQVTADTYTVNGDLSAMLGQPGSNKHEIVTYQKQGDKMVPIRAPQGWDWQSHSLGPILLGAAVAVFAPELLSALGSTMAGVSGGIEAAAVGAETAAGTFGMGATGLADLAAGGLATPGIGSTIAATAAGAGAAAGGGAFNAAADSQLANVAIDAAGGPGTALAGYTADGVSAAVPQTFASSIASGTVPSSVAPTASTTGAATTVAGGPTGIQATLQNMLTRAGLGAAASALFGTGGAGSTGILGGIFDNISNAQLAASGVTLAGTLAAQQAAIGAGQTLAAGATQAANILSPAATQAAGVQAGAATAAGGILSNAATQSAATQAAGTMQGGQTISQADLAAAQQASQGTLQGSQTTAGAQLQGATTASQGTMQGAQTMSQADLQGAQTAAAGTMQGANTMSAADLQGAQTAAAGTLQGANTMSAADLQGAQTAASGTMQGANTMSAADLQGAATLSAADIAAANTQAQGYRDASVQQVAGLNAAIGTAQSTLAEQKQLQQPYQAAGTQALSQLLTGLQPGGQFNTPFTMAMAQNMPAYAFALGQGEQAIGNSYAAKGGALSSKAVNDQVTFAEGTAAQYEQQAFNQWMSQNNLTLGGLQNMVSTGQTSTTQLANALAQAGLSIESFNTAIGQAQGAGTLGSATALAQGTQAAGAATAQGQVASGTALGQGQALSASQLGAGQTAAGTALGQGQALSASQLGAGQTAAGTALGQGQALSASQLGAGQTAAGTALGQGQALSASQLGAGQTAAGTTLGTGQATAAGQQAAGTQAAGTALGNAQTTAAGQTAAGITGAAQANSSALVGAAGYTAGGITNSAAAQAAGVTGAATGNASGQAAGANILLQGASAVGNQYAMANARQNPSGTTIPSTSLAYGLPTLPSLSGAGTNTAGDPAGTVPGGTGVTDPYTGVAVPGNNPSAYSVPVDGYDMAGNLIPF